MATLIVGSRTVKASCLFDITHPPIGQEYSDDWIAALIKFANYYLYYPPNTPGFFFISIFPLLKL